MIRRLKGTLQNFEEYFLTLRCVDCMSPLCRIRKAVQIPGKVASQFSHCHALAVRLYLQGEVTPHEFKALRNAWRRCFLALLEICPYLAENPGISLRGAPHRNADAAG